MNKSQEETQQSQYPQTVPKKTAISKSYHEYIEDGIQNHTAKAESYLKVGKLAAAKKEYKRIVFLDPTNLRCFLKLGEITSELGDYHNSILYYKRAQQIFDDPAVEDKIYQAMLHKGQQMLQNNKFDSYLQICKSSSLPPSRNSFYDSSSPNTSLKDIALPDPESPMTEAQNAFIRALAFLSENQKMKVIQELNVCAKLDPHNVYAHVLRGKIYWSLNQMKEGNKALWTAHAIDKDHPEVKEFAKIITEKSSNFHKTAVKMYFDKDLQKSTYFINKALDLDPKNVTYLLFRSFVYRKTKDFDKALQDIEIASQYVSPTDAEKTRQLGHQLATTYNDMGISMMELKKLDDAIVIFNEAIKFKEDDWGMIVNRGDCYRQLGQWENAIKDYKEALGIAGKRPEVCQRIGYCYHREALVLFNNKQYKQSAALLEKALEYDPSNTDYQMLKGKCYLFASDTKNAYYSLKKAEATDPSSLTVKMALSQVMPVARPSQPNIRARRYSAMRRSASTSISTLPIPNPS